MRPVPFAPNLQRRITQLYREGWTHKGIAEELGFSESTIRRALKRWGVPSRPAHRQPLPYCHCGRPTVRSVYGRKWCYFHMKVHHANYNRVWYWRKKHEGSVSGMRAAGAEVPEL